MRRKMLTTSVVTIGMCLTMAGTALAGEWRQQGDAWWYQNDDGNYPSNGWQWIDGKSYYFDSRGYCLTDTVTPDGYTVDASGAWIVNGVVQMQAESGEDNSLIGIYNFTFADGQGGASLEIGLSNEQADAIFNVTFSGSYGDRAGGTEGYIIPHTDGSDGIWEYYDNYAVAEGNYAPSMLLTINQTAHTVVVTSLDGDNFGGLRFPGFGGTYTK